VASVTRNLALAKTLTLTEKIETKTGSVLVGKVLNDKNTYNQLEDVHGRMSTVHSGDLVVGALGHRNALHGYEGVLPEKVCVGDTINLLNLGGVMGHCVSFNPEVGSPFEIEILGQVLVFPDFQSRVGKPANITMNALKGAVNVPKVPVIYIAGTCMNAGKTAAACTLVRKLTQAGYRVGGAKLTGVSLSRDILGMRDYGAEWSFDFTDTGVVSSTNETAVMTAQVVFSELSSRGAGVQAILADKELMSRSAGFLLCANDPVGVAGGIHYLKDTYGIDVDVITGPATDNRVGTRFVENTFGVPAINARTRGEQLGALILEKVKAKLEASK